MAERRRTRHGCQHCRSRHLKCDDHEVSCSACAGEGIPCIRGSSIRFRHGWNPSIPDDKKRQSSRTSQSVFDRNQPWCRTNRPLTFVDETGEVLSLYECLSEDGDSVEVPTTSSPINSGQSGPLAAPTTPTIDSSIGSPHSAQLSTRFRNASITPNPGGTGWEGPGIPQRADRRTTSFASSTIELFPSFDIPVPDPTIPDDVRAESAASALALLKCFEPRTHLPLACPEALLDTEPTVPPGSSGQQGPLADADDTPLPPLLQDIVIWPLRNEVEAGLFRYFIDYVSRAFDLCDPQRHFALVVPRRAILYSPLMSAIFAVSAKHLSRNRSFDTTISDQYYQRSLATLRPMLSEEAALMDENLFAATVILRNLEELEVPLSGADSNIHLMGNSLFAKASAALHDSAGPSTPILFTGLRRAAFLVAVRQEIYTAFVSQRPVSPAFSLSVINRSLDVDDADDFDWANRAVFHLAEVLGLCFSEDAAATPDSSPLARYDELVEYSQQWYERKPLSFYPIYYRDPMGAVPTTVGGDGGSPGSPEQAGQAGPGSFYPDVQLMSDAVSTGLQHFHLSRILLLAFNPRAPRIGPNRAVFAKEQSRCIREEVRVLAGIARSNTSCQPNYVSACMGIAVAGERFEERWEQEMIMGFLEETESLCAWPTMAAEQHLRAAWGWVGPRG